MNLILLLIAIPLIYWALKPLIRRANGAGGDFDKPLEGKTDIAFTSESLSITSAEEMELFSEISRKFFSPMLKINNIIDVETTKEEIAVRNGFESSSAYGCLVNFVEKFGRDYSGDNFNNLKKLLNSKGSYLDDELLKVYINREIKNQDYFNFKKLIFIDPTSSIEDYIKKFVSIYHKQLVLLRDYRKTYNAIKGSEVDLGEMSKWMKEEKITSITIKEQKSGVGASRIGVDPNSMTKFASEMAIKVNFLKKWFSENNIEMKNNIGLAMDVDELLQMIIDKLNEWELKRFEESLAKGERYSIENVDVMNGYQFESFLKTSFEKMGYTVEQTKLSGDQGADLIISKLGETTVVQAKRSNNKIGNNAIQEIVASINYYKAQKGMVVTNNEFTPAAIKLAESNKITLVDRSELSRLIKEFL